MTHIPIAIVGAGMTGLAAARFRPPVIKFLRKVEGQGGELASKRIEQQRADIGAQFFTVRDPRFQALVEAAYSAGAIQSWRTSNGNISIVDAGRFTRYSDTLCGCALHERTWAVFIPISQD